jgi:hypothetical protein
MRTIFKTKAVYRLVVVAVFLTSSASFSAFATDFRARDIQGIRLGMTPRAVEAVTHTRLEALGGGDFQTVYNHTKFGLGFGPAGHLYRIDSDQVLGVFQPDAKFSYDLTAKLEAKFGTTGSNMLPTGPIGWGFRRTSKSQYPIMSH